jgi:hypothetical protein
VKTLPKNLIEVYLSLATGDSTDEDDPALQRHRFEAGVDVWTTIQIEDDIEATTSVTLYQIQ